jgi:hypothetical protein
VEHARRGSRGLGELDGRDLVGVVPVLPQAMRGYEIHSRLCQGLDHLGGVSIMKDRLPSGMGAPGKLTERE